MFNDYINSKRRSNGMSDSNFNYDAMVNSGIQGGANITGTFNDPSSTGFDKQNSVAGSMQNTIGSINPVIGMGIGLGNMIGKPIRNNAEKFDQNGNLINEKSAGNHAILGSFFSPSQALGYRAASGNWGSLNKKDYTNWLEDEQKKQMGTYIAPNTTMGSENTLRYAQGGISLPNAEVEKQENTLNPDGSSTQFNGPSHDNGGIPTNLTPGTMIFSDRLKYKGKTFADLNKVNNTNKEDKILEDPNASPTLKKTAQLMKDTKVKNSMSLFQIQEELKANRGTKDFYNAANMVEYKNGGIHIKPENRGKFTAAAKRAGMGVQEYASHILAHKDNYNSTLVKRANFAHNASGWKHGDGGIQGEGSPINPKDSTYIVNQIKVNPLLSDKYKYNVQPDNKGNDVLYRILPNGKQLPVNYQNMKEIDRLAIKHKMDQDLIKAGKQPVYNIFQTHAMGGVQYPTGGWVPNSGLNYEEDTANLGYIPQTQYEANKMFQMESNRENPNFAKYSNTPKPYTGSTGLTNQELYDRDLNEANKRVVNTPNSNKMFDKNSLYNVGFGLAQNMGQIAYLAQQGKRYDKQQLYNYKPTLLDPTASLRYNDMQGRIAAENLKNAVNGNAGNYLANRSALAAQQMLANDAIRQQYANQNAGISNDAQMRNIQNKYMTDDINARNKGQALTNYYSTLGSLGTNTAQGMKDNRQFQTDKDVAGMLPKLFTSPEFQKFVNDNPHLFGK